MSSPQVRNYNPIVQEQMPIVQDLCQQDLAGLIYRHIGWDAPKDRGKTDWNTSGQILTTSEYFQANLGEYTSELMIVSAQMVLASKCKTSFHITSTKIQESFRGLNYRDKNFYEKQILGGTIWEFFWDIKELSVFLTNGYTGFHE